MKTPGWLRNWRLRQKIKTFQERGSNPWTPGYEEYKRQQISRALQAGCFDPNHLPDNFGYGLDERIVEIPWLFRASSVAKDGSWMRDQPSIRSST